MRSLLIVLICTISFSLWGQSAELGFNAGFSLYNGDLSPKDNLDYLKMVHPAGGIFLRVNTITPISVRLGANFGTISGDDENSAFPSRQLNFRSRISELYFVGEWNIFEWYPGGGYTGLSPYLFGGINLYYFNPEANFENQWVDLQTLGTEGQGLDGYPEKYDLAQMAIPMGVGLKIKLPGRWQIGLEVGARKLFTDYLDDVSDQIIVYEDVLNGNGPLAAQLSNPGFDPDTMPLQTSYSRGKSANDWYYIGGITFSYIISESGDHPRNSVRCPTF